MAYQTRLEMFYRQCCKHEKKALQFSFPRFPSQGEAKREDSIDEKSDFETVEDEEDALEFPYDNFPILGHCYAHTIQLVVIKDGLLEISQHLIWSSFKSCK